MVDLAKFGLVHKADGQVWIEVSSDNGETWATLPTQNTNIHTSKTVREIIVTIPMFMADGVRHEEDDTVGR